MVNKQLQCKYCWISQELKAIRKWNLVQNLVERLVPDSFRKCENWANLWIDSLKFFTVRFYFVPSWELSKYIETKLKQLTKTEIALLGPKSWDLVLLDIKHLQVLHFPYWFYLIFDLEQQIQNLLRYVTTFGECRFGPI